METKKSIILTMNDNGFDPEQIASITGIDRKDVEAALVTQGR